MRGNREALGPRGLRGFTMVEVLIVMGIVTIVATLGFWSAQSLLPGYRLNGAAGALRGDLYKAKVLAAKRFRQYKVAFTQNGYQIQRGTGSSGTFALDTVEESRTFANYPGVTVKTGATADPVFSPRGTATNVTITLQNAAGDEKTLTVSIAGRIKIH